MRLMKNTLTLVAAMMALSALGHRACGSKHGAARSSTILPGRPDGRSELKSKLGMRGRH
jgi:hypothetical protein